MSDRKEYEFVKYELDVPRSEGVRFEFKDACGEKVTFRRALELLKNQDERFCKPFVEALKTSFKSFFFETPPMTHEKAQKYPFEFVLLETSAFDGIHANPSSFQEHFENHKKELQSTNFLAHDDSSYKTRGPQQEKTEQEHSESSTQLLGDGSTDPLKKNLPVQDGVSVNNWEQEANQASSEIKSPELPQPAEEENCGSVAFKNIGGDSVLVAPCPNEGARDLNHYTHLGAFVLQASEPEVKKFFQKVGDTMIDRLEGEKDKPVWLSTCGTGVSWLHMRLDPAPKYYSYKPYKKEDYKNDSKSNL